MADAGVNTEGVSRVSRGWAALKTLFKRKPAKIQPETVFLVNSETTSILPNSGYLQFVEKLEKSNEVNLARLLNNGYPDLISVVNSDMRLTQEIKQAFLGGINQGDVEIIAISAARLAQKLNEETRSVEGRKDSVLKDKLGVASDLAKRMTPFL